MTPEQFRADPLAQRKAAIFVSVIAVGIAWLLLPWPLWQTREPPRAQSRGPFPGRTQLVARPEMRKPSTPGVAAPEAAPAPFPVPAPVPVYVPGADVFLPLLGKWHGESILVNRDASMCRLDMTLKEDGKEADVVNGYSSLACTPVRTEPLDVKCKADMAGCLKERMDKMAPTEAILAGKVADRAIRLQAQENLGTAATGCVMNSVVVRDFGGRIAVTWVDTCGGGDMVLRRIGR